MAPILSIGKIRGLAATSTGNGVFTILALDHRQALMKMIQPESPESVTYQQVVDLKRSFVSGLGKSVSAVLLDPIYGVSQMISSGSLPGSTGLMVAVEQSGYTGDSLARLSQIQPGWSVAKAKQMGANAIKLLVYYHPDVGEVTLHQEELVQNIIVDCRIADIPLFLEILTYSPFTHIHRESKEFSDTLAEILRRTAERLGGMGPDVLKLEFPINIQYDMDETNWYKACAQISEAAPCPWTLLSAGIEFDIFCRQVEIACKAGASGFIAGRAVWKDGIHHLGSQRKAWLETKASRSIDQLSSIATRFGKPWTAFYDLPEMDELIDWYLRYED
jgi:tagatose 1,6-diphosphate aldolase